MDIGISLSSLRKLQATADYCYQSKNRCKNTKAFHKPAHLQKDPFQTALKL